mmetsp:Transcript_17301/g.23748  ORF Transcript_17301/g.23748 Transcript_17301/m.23748 type:complete len:536 (+) Transcript_17301:243-1850(+)
MKANIIQTIVPLRTQHGLNQLPLLKRLRDDDYIEFIPFVEALSTIFDVRDIRDNKFFENSIHKVQDTCFSINPNGRYVPCCTNIACKYYKQPDRLRKYKQQDHFNGDSEIKDQSVDGINQISDANIDSKFTSSELLRIEILYNRYIQMESGKLRLRHVPKILQEIGLQVDKSRLPKDYWDFNKEFLIYDLIELKKWIDILRYRNIRKANAVDNMFRYTLPDWLKEEFKASEILLYEHHFALIDLDGGGSVDATELQVLLSSFGTPFSLEDSQKMLDEFDTDGTGSMDFIEFMVLIYKIQRNAVDLGSNDLAMAMSEAKTQLHIFEEIEDVARSPPPYCSVLHFGGAVIVGDFQVDGPPGSPYEGRAVQIQLTFRDGYPFIAPDIQIMTRMWCLHVVCQVDGRGRFITSPWESNWTIRTLLNHVVALLQGEESSSEAIERLPDNFRSIANSWLDFAKEYLQSKDQREDSDGGDGYSNTSSTCPSLEELCNCSASTAQMVRKLSRIEQLHLNVLYTFLFNRSKYDDIARTVCISKLN